MLEDSGKDLNAIAVFSSDEPVLSRLCRVSMDGFVDWEKGTCSFDGDDFKRMLSFAKEYTGNYTGGACPERIGRREGLWRSTPNKKTSQVHGSLGNSMYYGGMADKGFPLSRNSSAR